jgi:ABC-type glutathione transport system ATPase component
MSILSESPTTSDGFGDQPGSNGSSLLDVRGLKMYFPIHKGVVFQSRVGWVQAVDDITFDVKEGETLGLVGESGCGKSTCSFISPLKGPCVSTTRSSPHSRAVT